MYRSILKDNINKIHTTKLGEKRIKENLSKDNDVVEYCKRIIIDEKSEIIEQEKNYYCKYNDIIITINKYTYTIITAHKSK